MREDEGELWVHVTQECMSDEEDVGDSLKAKSPPWRSQEMNDLISQLDDRTQRQNVSDAKQAVRKRRIIGESPMKRKPSKKLSERILDQTI